MEKILYSAVVLDKESHKILVNEFSDIIPDGWKIFAHHMTIVFGQGLPEELERYLGMKVELRAIEFGISDLVMAVKVEGFETTNKIPHITLAVNVNDGGTPIMSNNILDWRRLSEVIGKNQITLTGTVEEIKVRR